MSLQNEVLEFQVIYEFTLTPSPSLFFPVTPSTPNAEAAGRVPHSRRAPSPFPVPGFSRSLSTSPRVAVPCTHAENGRRTATTTTCRAGLPAPHPLPCSPPFHLLRKQALYLPLHSPSCSERLAVLPPASRAAAARH